jgi:hypothetical protein
MKKKKKTLSFYLIPEIHLTYKFIIPNIKQNKILFSVFEI